MSNTVNNLRLVFAGTPQFSAQHLQYLIDQGHNIVGVYTQPDRPGKRGKKLVPSPVKLIAEENNLSVFQPINFKSEESQTELTNLNADVMVVVAYGLILPQIILAAPVHGCINVHASILPRWRGAAPIERAIAAGDSSSGVTIMQMDAGLDTGDMLAIVRCDIAATETGDSLREKLASIALPALTQTLESIAQQTLQPHGQDNSQSSYATKLNKQEAVINWVEDSAQIALKIRAFNSANVAYTSLSSGKSIERIKVWQAASSAQTHQQIPGTIIKADKHSIQIACGGGVLDIYLLQLPGGKVLDTAAVLNGRAKWFEPTTILGQSA